MNQPLRIIHKYIPVHLDKVINVIMQLFVSKIYSLRSFKWSFCININIVIGI